MTTERKHSEKAVIAIAFALISFAGLAFGVFFPETTRCFENDLMFRRLSPLQLSFYAAWLWHISRCFVFPGFIYAFLALVDPVPRKRLFIVISTVVYGLLLFTCLGAMFLFVP
jgi:hypothetical protein